MTLSRRQFLAALVAVLLAPRRGLAQQAGRDVPYRADISLLFGLLAFSLDGCLEARVDPDGGHYRVVVDGHGEDVAHRIESAGHLRGGRFTPDRTEMLFSVWGRESRSRLEYDHGQGLIHARYSSETFLLGRPRSGEDLLPMPTGLPLDDVVTATLNYAEGLLESDGQAGYRTLVVRRKGPEPDEPGGLWGSGFRAEVVPLRFAVTEDRESGRAMCLLDLTAFSSWARSSDPARVVFGTGRWPESIEAPLILGSRFRIAFRPIA